MSTDVVEAMRAARDWFVGKSKFSIPEIFDMLDAAIKAAHPYPGGKGEQRRQLGEPSAAEDEATLWRHGEKALTEALAGFEGKAAQPPADFPVAYQRMYAKLDADDLACLNQVIAMARASVQPPQWRCFHCDDVFTDAALAAEHFGMTQASEPGCLLKLEGGEQGLLAKVRECEASAIRYMSEDTHLHREIARLHTDNFSAVRHAEEEGYAKGLADGRAQPSAISDEVSVPREWTPHGVKRQDVCVWMQDSDGAWNTSCQQTFEFAQDGPAENHAYFCYHCGGALLPEPYSDDAAAQEGK